MLFTVGCLFCVAVQLMIIIFNLAVISVFDCLVRVCKSRNKHIDYRIQLFIPVGSLGILATLFGPLLKVLNTWHKFFPLGDFFQNIDILFGQRRKKCVNQVALHVFLFLKFFQSFSNFISWLWRILNFKSVGAGYENPLFPAHFVERHFGIILLADFLFRIWRKDAGFEQSLSLVTCGKSCFFIFTWPCTTQVKMRSSHFILMHCPV